MKTILLIEDNELIRENTAEILELAGYDVLTAENGKLGVEQALAKKPDLVVCDIMMPVLDGYGVLQIFNQNPQLSGVPFIFLTAKTERLSAITSRLNRFRHLNPDDDLQGEGLNEFLDDARAVGNLASLSADRKVYQVRKKQDIYLEGDEPNRVYFLKSGRVKTVKTTDAGKELITGLYGPGEFFGYLPLLENTDHSDSAVAVDDSELVYIPKDDFTQLVMRNPEVGQQFIRLLAGRVSEREQQLLGMAYSSIRRRVADILLRLHEQSEEGSIQLSREDMAAMVGTASESLIRTLSEFKQDGLIELTPKNIKVLQPEKLRRAHW